MTWAPGIEVGLSPGLAPASFEVVAKVKAGPKCPPTFEMFPVENVREAIATQMARERGYTRGMITEEEVEMTPQMKRQALRECIVRITQLTMESGKKLPYWHIQFNAPDTKKYILEWLVEKGLFVQHHGQMQKEKSKRPENKNPVDQYFE